MQNGASNLLALSIFCLAGALIYFTVSVTRISRHIPNILSGFERASQTIDPVATRVEEIHKMVPEVLIEVAKTREQIPALLEEARLIREQLPHALRSVDKASEAVVLAAREVEAIRPLIPGIINEMEKTRDAVPAMLDQASQVISQAKQEATERSVVGAIKGVVSAPFVIVGDIGKKIFGLVKGDLPPYTEEDIQLLNETIRGMLPLEQINGSKTWTNPETGYSGTVGLKFIDRDEGRECKTFHIQTFENQKLILSEDVTLCLKERGEWEYVR